MEEGSSSWYRRSIVHVELLQNVVAVLVARSFTIASHSFCVHCILFCFLSLGFSAKMPANFFNAVALAALFSSALALPQRQYRKPDANGAPSPKLASMQPSVNLASQEASENMNNTQPLSGPSNTQPSTNVASSQPPTTLCGNDHHIILDGTPWLVANSMYGAGSMAGTSCTQYDHIETGSGGNPRVVWGSTTHIQNVEST